MKRILFAALLARMAASAGGRSQGLFVQATLMGHRLTTTGSQTSTVDFGGHEVLALSAILRMNGLV